MIGKSIQRYTVTLTPPSWVRMEQTARTWAKIACVRVVGYQQEGQRVTVMVEGTAGDVAQFERIVKLNTERW